MNTHRKTWIALTGGSLVAVAAIYWFVGGSKNDVKWRKAKVEYGAIIQRISATGALSGLIQVNVGTQVSGTLMALYVDYNSQVTKGQRIAQIDPTLYQAALQDAQAGVARAQTTLDDAKRQLERAKRLAQDKLLAIQDLDARQVAHEMAVANLETARATLTRARTNLGYCTITAPVSGVVVSRAVDVGQTVAASFSTPTLFVIAQDLTKMKLESAIDEADIGQVSVGQKGQFTVDAFPDVQFKGTVSQVRLEPITQQNVVTYKVVIEVANEDLKLRPGMTANVSITTNQKDKVLKVPTAALRLNPKAFLASNNGKSKEGDNPASGKETSARKGAVSEPKDRVWVLVNGKPTAIPVKVGITDGQFTEISGADITEGREVLVGVEESTKRAQGPALIMPRR